MDNNNKYKSGEYYIFKYLWLIALCPKVIQFFILGAISIGILKLQIGKNDRVFSAFMIYVICHILSIFLNGLVGTFDVMRMIAAMNTALIWIIAIQYYGYYKRHDVDIIKVSKYMMFNVIILIMAGITGFILYDQFGVTSVTFAGRNLMSRDYLLGVESVRLVAFLEHSNLVNMLFYMCFPISLIYIRSANKSKQYLYYLISLFPVYLSKSRTAIIISTILTIISIYTNLKEKKKKILVIIGSLILLIVLFGTTDYVAQIYQATLNLINGRSNSTNTRLIIYMTSIEAVLKNNLLLGMGIKIMRGDYPLGSHSTYLGVFYKTGVLGSLFFLLGLFNMIGRYIRLYLNYKNIRHILIYYIFMFINIAVIDIDGAN